MGRVIPLFVPNGQPRDLIKLSEAAALMGVSRATVYNWVKAGKLRVWIHTGKGWKMVRRADAIRLGSYHPEDAEADRGTASEAG
jgi:excisionase family DNA binding protein